MKTIITATAVALFSINAQAGVWDSIKEAFTEKAEVSTPIADECNSFSCSGWVVSNGKKMKASETPSGKAALEKDGYLVASGYLFVEVQGVIIETEISKIAGKAKPEIIEQIKADAGVQINIDIAGGFDEEAAKQAAYEASVAAEGAIDASNMSLEEAVEAAAEGGRLTGIDDDMANQIGEALSEADGVEFKTPEERGLNGDEGEVK